ncbi:hypothetical protein ACFYY9_16765 [Streptomyces nigra]|uniref:hypothetical protein n=1 Tax=Streptomyces nigra TaxID=1827580 RepID=UPI0036AB5516
MLKGPPRGGTPEQREEYLLDQVVDLHKQYIALHQELTAERQQREAVVSELAEAVTHQESRALAAIAKAKTDGLGLEAFGLSCVVLGVVLATIGSLT